ncbi:hypothetical protein [Burkholderia multivorans]|uniref:hypothetical protein n=1 Tax=Burkholderia multivorans TaxID=87883 RepID=UPI000CFFC087|nr:hypothetical protein [Burkholderia multivorans]MBY4791623.1 hypothetical protein [Burkholderia multivorans]PRE59492.1 hypothetical protein C6P86_23520 [Burkholderia multivorans]PRE77051.1 hypothetical protein C6Q00_27445 [Burkholderia multivorans]PRG17267.1 hypothetical protein C6T57_26140 [Burkholderia multivorans]
MKAAAWHFEIETPESGRWFEAYVGLLRDRDSGRQVLRLPIGYAAMPVADPHRCLGQITRTIAHFRTLFSESQASGYKRDGYLEGEPGQRLAEGISLAPEFSRIHACIQLMRQLQDPRLLAVVRRPGLAARFSDRQISPSLEHAHFLADGTPVFEQMWAQTQQIRHTNTDLVGMAAWVALDALAHLFPDIVATALSSALRAEWELLAEHFAMNFGIDSGASLLADSSGITLRLVRDALAWLQQTSPVFLADARQLHEWLDCYLNDKLSDGGDIRELKGFNRVWEAACLEHARTLYGDDRIFTCDDEMIANVPRATREC